MKRWNAFACLLLILALELIPSAAAVAQSSTGYAPIRFWNVRNWYSDQTFALHRYNSPGAAFSEWEAYGVASQTFTAPCGTWPGQEATHPFVDTYFIQSSGYETNSLANAHHMIVACFNSYVSGPHTYGSSAIRFWGCSDSGPWGYPYTGSETNCGTIAAKADPEVNRGAPECPDHCAGDPINTSNGAKFESRTEYASPGEFPLEFTWTYNSNGVPVNALRADRFLGRNRSHTFMRRVSVSSTSSVTTAYVARPDGKTLRFNKQAAVWTPAPNVNDSLEEILGPSGTDGWILKDGSGAQEYYAVDGSLLRLVSPAGRSIVVSRDVAGRPQYVTDERGRKLIFEYSSSGLLDALSLPDGTAISFDYNSFEDLTKVTYADGSSRHYLYDETAMSSSSTVKGLLTGVIDEAGVRYSTTTYDSQARATSTYLSGGVRQYSVAYTAGGPNSNIVQSVVTEPLGATRTIGASVDFGKYRASGTTRACAGCQTDSKSYVYGTDGRIDSLTNNGVVTEFDLNSTGLEVKRVEAANISSVKRTVETDWDLARRLPLERRTIDSAGATVSKQSWSYNSRGQVLTAHSIQPVSLASRTISYSYCEQADVAASVCPSVGLLLAVDGPRTDVLDKSEFTYRASDDSGCATAGAPCSYRKGDLWKIEDAVGATTEILGLDGAGRITSVKDANGVVTETAYQARGWVASTVIRGQNPVSTADDSITTYEYWPTGLIKKVTGPDETETSFEYDAAHRLTAIADGAGNRIEYTLDAAGNRIAENTKGVGGVLKRTLSRVYNSLGQLATQADAQANPTDFTYDAHGNVDTVENALGSLTDNIYDPLNRLIRTLQDVGGIAAETKFEYDANDNLTKVTDPKGLETTYTYNGFGDHTQLSSPDTGLTTFTYDSAGNRASQIDARGVTTTYQYDALNRLTQVGYPTPSLNVAYTYDVTQSACQVGETFSVGRLTLMVDGSGSTQYCYDRFGQLTRKVQTINGVALTLQYEYTKSGQLQTMVYPDGTVADYVRNAQGQVTEVGVTRPGQAREILLDQATYHPFGPIAGWVYGNGRIMQRKVDLDYRPTSILGGTGGLNLTYGYDAVGNLTSLASGSPPPLEYGYDALGRLTESRDGPTQAIIDRYTYDKTGNRTRFTDSLGTRTYTYPATSHRLDAVDSKSRTYDAAGNTLTIGMTRAFTYSDAGRMSAVSNGGVIAMQYAYNGRGEQVRRHLGSIDTYTLYDEAGHWVGDYAASGTPVQQALWMDDMPVGLLTGGALKHVQPDHLGTPRAVIDPVPNVAVWAWDLKGEAFGSTAPQQDPDGDGVPFVLDMRFPGQRYDAASSLHYNYFRDYDASTGRYPQSDPIGLRGGINSYAYSGSQPIMMIDPLGLQSSMTGAGAAQSAGTTAGAYNPYSPNNPNSVSPAVPQSGSINWPNTSVPEVTGDGLLESLVKMSPLGMLSELEKAISDKLNNVCDDDNTEDCEELLRVDTDTCSAITRRRGARAGAVCHASASQRYAACLRGSPIPPLSTWNN